MNGQETIKGRLLSILKANDDWIWGGSLENDVSKSKGCKTSNVGRRLRELENTGIIERRLQYINHVHAVQYRYKGMQELTEKERDLELLKLSVQ